MGPLVDVLVDDLDPVAGPQEGADRPRLVAEDAPLELQVAKQRAMEDLAVDRRVVHQAGWVAIDFRPGMRTSALS